MFAHRQVMWEQSKKLEQYQTTHTLAGDASAPLLQRSVTAPEPSALESQRRSLRGHGVPLPKRSGRTASAGGTSLINLTFGAGAGSEPAISNNLTGPGSRGRQPSEAQGGTRKKPPTISSGEGVGGSRLEPKRGEMSKLRALEIRNAERKRRYQERMQKRNAQRVSLLAAKSQQLLSGVDVAADTLASTFGAAIVQGDQRSSL